MRLIFLLFGSLNRRALESYGGTTVWTANFSRLAEKAVSIATHYVGSLPICIARREARVASVRAAGAASGTEPVGAPPLRAGA